LEWLRIPVCGGVFSDAKKAAGGVINWPIVKVRALALSFLSLRKKTAMRNDNLLPALLGGLAGAVTVTLLNEGLRRVDAKAPRLEQLGMDAANQALDRAGVTAPKGRKLFWGAMAGDLLSNTLYYALGTLGSHKKEKTTGLGLAAGLGAVLLPQPMGLVQAPTNRTVRTKVMTTAYYLIGSWVAGLVAQRVARA
jgi:hypothetical protein